MLYTNRGVVMNDRNALDAKATSVDIKLMDDGLLKIEARL